MHTEASEVTVQQRVLRKVAAVWKETEGWVLRTWFFPFTKTDSQLLKWPSSECGGIQLFLAGAFVILAIIFVGRLTSLLQPSCSKLTCPLSSISGFAVCLSLAIAVNYDLL